MELGADVEYGGFVVSRVWMLQIKSRRSFNVHARWKKEGEEERTVLLGCLHDSKKDDEAAIRAMLEIAAEKENKKRNEQEEQEEEQDDGPLIGGDAEKGKEEQGRCVVCVLFILESGVFVDGQFTAACSRVCDNRSDWS